MSAHSRARTPGSKRGKAVVAEVAVASVALVSVAAADAQVPTDVDATAVYLGIVAAVAWRNTWAIALAAAVVAWGASIAVDLAAHPTDVAGVVVWNAAAGFLIFVGIAALVRKVRLEREALLLAATHDALTGLPNRVLLRDRFEQALLASVRENFAVGVLVFDLDGFKRLNDARGHHAGDQLLRLVATRARSAIRSSDTCARTGGDEFAVLLPRTSEAGLTRVAEALRKCCAEPFLVDGTTASVTASVGTALSPNDGTDPDVLLRVADTRMYEAKAQRSRAMSAGAPSR